MTIGERIKELRTSLGMTQDELAKLTGYKSRSSIQKIECGERDITQSAIVSFARALKVTPSVIMGWEDTELGLTSENLFEKYPNIMPIPEMRKVPLVGAVACGKPIYREEDEEAVGSSPVTSTNKNSPLNRYNAWFKGLFIFNICLYVLFKTGLFCSLFRKHGCQDGCQNGSAIMFIYAFYTC
nr:MAG TPA: hypothetical protein [Caudoviricetes sp.]